MLRESPLGYRPALGWLWSPGFQVQGIHVGLQTQKGAHLAARPEQTLPSGLETPEGRAAL